MPVGLAHGRRQRPRRLLEPKRLGKLELMQGLGQHAGVEGITQVAANDLHGVAERPPGKLRPAPSKELVERCRVIDDGS